MDYSSINYDNIAGTNIFYFVHHGELANLYFLRIGSPNTSSETPSDTVRFTGYQNISEDVAIKIENNVTYLRFGELSLGAITSREPISEETFDRLLQIISGARRAEDTKAEVTKRDRGRRKRGKEGADEYEIKRTKREDSNDQGNSGGVI